MLLQSTEDANYGHPFLTPKLSCPTGPISMDQSAPSRETSKALEVVERDNSLQEASMLDKSHWDEAAIVTLVPPKQENVVCST